MSPKQMLLCSSSIILVSLAVYFPIIGNDFLSLWDDGWQVFNNNTEEWSWPNVWEILTTYRGGQYSPLNQAMYTILYHFAGYNPAWFHATSLLLHTGNALLVFFITHSILATNPGNPSQKNLVISLGVALLLVVHPLQVEAVAWISASKVLLYSFFYLWAIWFYLRYLKHGTIADYIAVLLCYTLSFGGKEQAITLLVCLFWIDLVCRRNFKDGSLWYEKIPILFLTLFFVFQTLDSHNPNNPGLFSQADGYTLIQRLVFACYSFCEYLVKTIHPINLMYIYPFPMLAGEPLPTQFLIYPLVVLVAGVCFRNFWKRRPVWLGMSWFFIHIAMMLHVIPISRFTIVADRYVYLALPGVFFVIVWYLHAAWEYWPQHRKWIISCSFICLSSLGVVAFLRTNVWCDNDMLKKDVRELLEQREFSERQEQP
jgi:hypothetical protein